MDIILVNTLCLPGQVNNGSNIYGTVSTQLSIEERVTIHTKQHKTYYIDSYGTKQGDNYGMCTIFTTTGCVCAWLSVH